MHIELHERFTNEPRARQAQALTSACVHCGFCLETCPTYLDGRDERDSPRGRVYLIKALLEEGEAGPATRTHLDRCLTCRNCETTCPSGMQYGRLLDIGRELIEEEAPRAASGRLVRSLLRFGFSRPSLLRKGLAAGRLVRPFLPAQLKRKVPPAQQAGAVPQATHARRMLVLEGCVQSAATPLTNAAARRVLDKLGISLVSMAAAGCCGALDHHLAAVDSGRDRVRRNIDAWWPHVEAGAEAIVASASGCGVHIADYGHLLADDPAYASKAARISTLFKDLAQVLASEDLGALALQTNIGKVAVHTPCTLQH
ncbi:MAG: glycolate oxidase subunit GlcF, partial [Halioglobus sp.]|nr:glycolate oxidase subunit GlcF [Halioglobus sp.]